MTFPFVELCSKITPVCSLPFSNVVVTSHFSPPSPLSLTVISIRLQFEIDISGVKHASQPPVVPHGVFFTFYLLQATAAARAED